MKTRLVNSESPSVWNSESISSSYRDTESIVRKFESKVVLDSFTWDEKNIRWMPLIEGRICVLCASCEIKAKASLYS